MNDKFEKEIIEILKLLSIKDEIEKAKKIDNKLTEYKDIYSNDFIKIFSPKITSLDIIPLEYRRVLSYIAFELKKKLLIDNSFYKKSLGLVWFWDSWMGDLYNLEERMEKLNKWGEKDDICDEELGWGYGEIYKWWSYNFTPERLIIVYFLTKKLQEYKI